MMKQLKTKSYFSNNTRELETHKAKKNQAITHEAFWQLFATIHKYGTQDINVNIISLFQHFFHRPDISSTFVVGGEFVHKAISLFRYKL